MAAIDLERGLEHRGRGWGQERPELMDNFDSEMQEWEDQLQDIQKKIEELYNEVQARRGANDITTDNQKNGSELECGLGHHGNGLFGDGKGHHSHHSKNHPAAITVPHHYSNGCNYSPSGYSYPVSHQNGYGYCHTNSEIGDLLQDYLEQGKQMSQKNNGARHVRFSDTIKVNPETEIRKSSGRERLGQEQCLGSFEETENRKNQVSHMKSSPRRESSPNKENTGAKPPLGQRDAPAVQPRSQLPIATAGSPVPDRKSFSPGVLGDRKCGSPSVLRKFGAMLQENEGKMLTESGVVTHQGPEPKCPTPGCQRRALGATAVAGRAPMRVPTQKCQADFDVLTAEIEPGQEWGLVSDSGRQNHKDHRGAYKGSQRVPQQSQRRSQVAGSPKMRPRANSAADRDGGLAQGERARRPAPQHAEPKMDYMVSSASSGAQKIHRGGFVGQELPGCGRVRDEGLIELLDMLEIQHEYSSSPRVGHTAYRQDPQQVNPAQSSPANLNNSFSRPARPANQRPPSRWAGRTPTAIITSPSGPMYRPPSPLARTPSPMTRTPSPALKHRPLVSYSLQTETVIM
ncbi:uncharacterized protein LOC115003593 [Cottoperca gobio]|uniref:Uncharacterized protein LOC115003593 n=1 Tax=Cottoperca gobio TaxID=56716 RepID=A0A6J2P7R0_COTGO|nr:uncharacterized protein LOC115003593 [Cottoperca gobio]XP_029281308.1 uncharacterized protein LOC115003593 [Cottoperca gobio]